ncbi:MAG: UbiH/UbiF/VisC/COQ6 family ubiquinone biosynthesis hydroxylase [Gammaproteobacteria bacterium]
MTERFDVIVAGAGMVGACAALSLARCGFRVALIEPGPIPGEPYPADSSYDLRVSAISPASQQILSHLGVWSALDQSRVGHYHQMVIWHENGDANIAFDCVELGKDSLGAIVENRQILQTLLAACEKQANIEWFTPDAIGFLQENSDQNLRLSLKSGVDLESELLLGADGRNSNTRTLAGIDRWGGSYDQIAIVASLVTELPHRHTAWQRFLSSGPLAFLPLANGESSIVWSCDTELAQELLEMDEESFCDAVGDAIEHRLGAIKSIGERLSFPLSWHTCQRWLENRVLLIGDAAHGVHPLAGQGVNLGFSDVDVLTKLIGALKNPWDHRKLRQFERQRKSETVIATHLFTGLKWLYGSDNFIVSRLRDFGMHRVQANPWSKRLLMKQAIRNMA